MKKRMLSGIAGVVVWMAAWNGWAAVEQPVTCRIELDRGVLPAGGTQTAVMKITLDAIAPPRADVRPPVNLAIVMDRSGSMSGQKIENAKEAAIAALRRLGARDYFSLVIYDDQVETIVPAQSAANTEWIESRIRQIRSRGNTALFAGVCQGAAEIRKNIGSGYVNRIVLLSDGVANVGPSAPADLARLGASLLKEDISVTTVGVGNDYNEDLMTQLAQNSDGNTYFVETESDLPRIFAAELGDVLSVVAKKVILDIRCEDGVRPVRIIGRDGRVRNDSVEVYLNQLYGGQEKYVLVEVEVPAGQPDEVRQIAYADCRYQNALNQQDVKTAARVSARYSAREAEVKRSANVEVQQEVIVNVIAEAKDDSVEMWDRDDQKGAVQRMNVVADKLRQLGQALSLPASSMAPVDELEEEAKELETEGMSPKRRKSYRAESYQTRTQQSAQ
ncbi:MAG: VWA domain-containing protein [Spartobacteria bacterium]|nr:VWA domain-containing protein [Spartobacteria bacterium]